MYQFLLGIVSGAVFALPHYLFPTSSTGLISKATLDWTETIRLKYDIPGISIGIIASPERTKDGWKNETFGLGYMNMEGRAVDGDVSVPRVCAALVEG